jgi:hypothetical protein
MNATLLKVAALLAAVAGVLEFYQVFTFVEEIKRGTTNPAKGVLIYVMPLLIIAGAAALYTGRIVVGAGTVLIGTSLQHTMIDLTGRHMLGFGLALVAIFLSMYLQMPHDRDTRAAEPPPT